MYCIKCGEELNINDNFCSKCGFRSKENKKERLKSEREKQLKAKQQEKEKLDIEKLKEEEQKKYEKERIKQEKIEEKRLKKEEKIQKKIEKRKENHGTLYLNELKNIGNQYSEKLQKPKHFCQEVKINYGVLLDDFDILDFETKQTIILENKYSETLTQHYLLLEQEDMLYSTAINLPSINNDVTKKCIDICKQDIELAEDIKQYHIEEAKISNTNPIIPNYPAFYYLTQLYDKSGKIDEAIKICKMAIDLGYYKDNSKGGMPARLARLIKKKNSNK